MLIFIVMFIYQRRVPPKRTSSLAIMNLFIKKHKRHATIVTMAKRESKLYTIIRTHGELLGWIGTSLIIGSYALLSLGVIGGDSYVYHVLVLTGSVGVAIISYIKQAYQPFVINAFFVAIALIALLRITYFA